MIEFKTDKVLGNTLDISLSDDGLIEEVYLDGWCLDLDGVMFKDQKDPDGKRFVDLATLLYDDISEQIITHNYDRKQRDREYAAYARQEVRDE